MSVKKYFYYRVGNEFYRARSILLLQAFLTLMIIIYENVFLEKLFTVSFFLQLIIYFLLYSFYFSSQKRLNYSFWGMSTIIILYLLQGVVFFLVTKYNPLLSLLNIISLTILLTNMYIMSQPLFYPRVQWWEYDFRYRGDLKIFIRLAGKTIEARITDFRREAGSIESFENFLLGDLLKIELNHDNKQLSIAAQVRTIKVYIPGRPIRYGVKFIFDQNFSRKNFKELKNAWDLYKNVKLREKFKAQ